MAEGGKRKRMRNRMVGDGKRGMERQRDEEE